MAVVTATPVEEPLATEAQKAIVKDPPSPPPSAAADNVQKPPPAPSPAAAVDVDDQKPPIPPAASFREESNLVSDLTDPEKKALDDLKQLVHAALAAHDFFPPPPPQPATEEQAPKPAETPVEAAKPEDQTPAPPSPPAEAEEKPDATVAVDDDGAKTVEAIEETVVSVSVDAERKAPEEATPAVAPPEEVSIWGVSLLADDRSDTVLLKFLRARDFKPKEAFAMLKAAVAWRREFGIEALLEEDLAVPELEKAVFMRGVDREGHPVCYNVFGEFQEKELYALAFADGEKRKRFLRWRIQFLERGIRQLLDFSPGGVSTMVQVTDLGSSPGPLKRDLRQALAVLQDNYPEFAAKQVFINVPWWYLAFNTMISPFFTQRSKSKFVFAGPSKSAETLFKYIAPEHIPVRFGGLGGENDSEFTTADAATETNLKPSLKQIIEIPVAEKCLLVWEIRVLGWDVTYGAEFVPSTQDGYTVIVQKARKLAATDEPVVKNSFKIGEPGKMVLTVDNATSKKKKLLYRYKAKSSLESIFEAAERKEIKS